MPCGTEQVVRQEVQETMTQHQRTMRFHTPPHASTRHDLGSLKHGRALKINVVLISVYTRQTYSVFFVFC